MFSAQTELVSKQTLHSTEEINIDSFVFGELWSKSNKNLWPAADSGSNSVRKVEIGGLKGKKTVYFVC